MAQKPWAIDDLIINDETNMLSKLFGGVGLPAARARLSKRHGRWPAVTGLDRPGHRMTLKTFFKHSTAATRKAARTDLLQYLNPELGETVRLTAVDNVVQGIGRDGVLLAMGPWDMYCGNDGAWHVRDLLRPDTIEGDLSGAWRIGPGEGMELARAGTNVEPNPIFEIDTSGWATAGSNTISRSFEQGKRSSYSLKCVYQDSQSLAYDVIALTAAIYSLSAWVYVPKDYDGGAIRLYFYNFTGATGTLYADADMDLRDQWQLIQVPNVTIDAGDLTGWLLLYALAPAPTAGRVIYLDGVQCTQSVYCWPHRNGDMPGCAWSGTEHNSSTTITAAQLDVSIDDIGLDFTDGSEGTIGIWCKRADWDGQYGAASAYAFRARTDANNYLYLIWYSSTQVMRAVWTGQANVDVSDDYTGQVDGEYSLFIVTWDFTGDNQKLDFYWCGELQDSYDDADPFDSNPTTLEIGHASGSYQWNGSIGLIFALGVYISAQQADEWHSMGADGFNARRLDVKCEAAPPWAPGGTPTDRGVVATLAVDKEVRWRQRDGDVHFWRCYDGNETTVVDVDTEDDVYPEFRITARTAKTAGFQYRQWQAVKWDSSNSATDYPVMLGAFNLTGKAQGDGDDIRVYVDGTEVDRWLGGTLVSAVKVWANLDFEADVSLTLAEAIAASGDIDYIQFNEDISDLPVEGIIYIDSEAFTYTDKNNRTRKVAGITREAKGTSAASHSASTAAYWIQHDVWMYYDDSTLSAPTVDDDYKPAFDLDNSTNSSWDYNDFGEDDGLRVAQWADETIYGSPTIYTANRGTDADPHEEIGIKVTASAQEARWYVYCPCGISNVNFANGEKYDANKAVWFGRVESSVDGSSWTTEYSVPAPSADSTWESWSYSAAITASSLYAAMWMSSGADSNTAYLECADVTLTIDNPVTATASAEQNNYPLVCTITNGATGEAIMITAEMVVDQVLVVDTYEKSAILDDGTRLATAVVTDTTRQEWLRMVDGENELAFEDSGTQEVEIDILWDRRLFE